jgi:hypothetical protein
MENTSLDDFRDATPGADIGGIDPATTTFAWSPRGEACARCGEQARERWHGTGGGGLVCGACKEWSALDG